MPIPAPPPRHTVEKDDHVVRITLPSKKNAFYILATLLWLFMWAYFIFSFLYIALTLKQLIDIGKNSQPLDVGFIIMGLFFLFFFLVLIALGVFGIYRFFWLLAGKEIIEADTRLLKISRQTF